MKLYKQERNENMYWLFKHNNEYMVTRGYPSSMAHVMMGRDTLDELKAAMEQLVLDKLLSIRTERKELRALNRLIDEDTLWTKHNLKN